MKSAHDDAARGRARVDAMDLNLLRVFETVFRERHLTRAAQALALTPSAVSHALRRLREQLGDPLFVRAGAQMAPTATCQRMAPALIAQLAGLRHLLQQWGAFEPARGALELRVGMPEAVELLLLPPLHRAFAAAAPAASLASVALDRAGAARALASGQLDLYVDVALPAREPVRHRALLDDDFCIVARAGHPLRRGPTLAQYLAARHVAVSGRATGVVIEDDALLRLGVERRVAVRCQGYTAALRVVASSDCLLTAPARILAEVGRAYGLERRRLPFALPPVQLHLYWHANSERDPANAWLRELVRAAAGDRGVALASAPRPRAPRAARR